MDNEIKNEEMEKVTTVDIEGDPHNGYWYVCEECRHIVNWKMEKCPCCGRRLNWNG